MEYFAVLATDDHGQPYTSLVNFALTPDCKAVIFATPRQHGNTGIDQDKIRGAPHR